MRKLGESINELMAALAAGDDASRKAQRAAAVNVAWRNERGSCSSHEGTKPASSRSCASVISA